MQQAPFAWSGYPTGTLSHKHRLDDEVDADDLHQPVVPFNASTAAGPPSHQNVRFSEHNLEAANAVVAAAKRRKGNTGNIALPPDLEPQFESLSLKTVTSTPGYLRVSPHYPSIPLESPTIDAIPYTGNSSSARGRIASLSSLETPRGRRDGTPIVSPNSISSAHHRRRSSSRNRARKTSSSSDIDMKPAPRYDPARPHVVFVDSLSDSDDGNNTQNSDTEATSVELSALSTPGNSPSSSDAEDTMDMPVLNSARPIQMNKRLRDHLRKQAMLQRLGHKPVPEGLLATAPATTGGAGIRERGLILYRPLSWGIVEEPDDEDSEQEEGSNQYTPSSDVSIQELPSDGYSFRGDMPQSDLDGMEIDEEMEIDQ